MTITEIIVIVAGLVVGWLLISKLMSNMKVTSDILPDSLDASWNEILDVPIEADPAMIQTAYERRLADLERNKPLTMTDPEAAKHAEACARLDAARREGLGEHV